MPTKNPLPPKEAALFRKVVRCYEVKQYKNGIKFANQILSKPKFTDHGETLAMKGLILMCQGRRDDALDLVRRGLRNDLQSHVCWHVYGLVQRALHKYDEAIKAYRNALKWEKDNVQILRDLSLLQIQMRDMDGFKDTRYQLLAVRPSQKASWVGYAVALHLLGDFNTALRVLEEFKKTQEIKELDFEVSELILYMASVMSEAGRITDSLEFLSRHESLVCDIVTLQETKANLLMKIPGRTTEAKKIYETLLERNPENRLYVDRLVQIVSGQAFFSEKVVSSVPNPAAAELLLNELLTRYPKSPGLHFFALTAFSAENVAFAKMIAQYLRDGIEKGIPPLFVSLRPLYKDVKKREIIEKIVVDYVSELSSSSRFTKADVNKEPPTSFIWASYFLAQHYDYLKKTDQALDVINQAIQCVPTLPDLLMGMARILKHSGNLGAAAAWADEAQSLDTADRYLNYKCARYMIRCGRLEDAEALLSKFTKPSNNDGSSAATALSDMQCMWFLLEMAASYRRQGKIGEALKKLHDIERHFSQMYEDQFDFHTYCPRKMTLSPYVKLVRLTDTHHKHRFFVKAAQLCVGIYCDLVDDPQFAERFGLDADGLNLKDDDVDAKERKKLKSKQRKQQAKQLADNGDKDGKDGTDKEKEQTDAVGQVSSYFASLGLDGNAVLDVEKLAHPSNPLDIAISYAKQLIDVAPELIDAQLLSFELYWRRGTVLRMVSAVRRASRATSLQDPQTHYCVVRLLEWLEKNYAGLTDMIKRVVDKQLFDLLGSSALPLAGQYNSDWYKKLLESGTSSLEQTISFARSLYQLNQSAIGRENAFNSITEALKNNSCSISLQTATNLYNAMTFGRRSGCGWSFGIEVMSSEKVDILRQRLHSLFPYATLFMSKDESANVIAKMSPPSEPKQSPESAPPMSNGICSDAASLTHNSKSTLVGAA